MSIRLEPVDSIRKFQLFVFNSIINKACKNVIPEFLKVWPDFAKINAFHGPFEQWKKRDLVAMCSLIDRVTNVASSPIAGEFAPITSMLSKGVAEFICGANIVDQTCVPFIFTDAELVNAIMESKISKVPTSAIRLPYDQLIIQLPCHLVVPDGSGDMYNCVVVVKESNLHMPNDAEKLMSEGMPCNEVVRKGHVLSMMFTDSKKYSVDYLKRCGVGDARHASTHAHIIMNDGEDTMLDTDDPVDKLTFDSICIPALKLIFFLTSPSAIVDVVHRDKKSLRGEPVRHAFRSLHYVKFSKTHTEYEYDDESPSGRTVHVRFRVIGHFKHFTKGTLAGRVIWCPPHWKGPEVAEQTARAYVVGSGNQDG